MNLTRGQLWAGIIAFPSIATLIILYHHAFLAAVIYEAAVMLIGWVIVLIGKHEEKVEKTRPPARPVPWLGENQP